MAFADYDHYDGIGLAELVANGAVTASELLEEAITRAETRGTALNAIIYKDYDRARQIAATSLPSGPFSGVPFLLKDISLQAQGTPTRQGSRFFPPTPSDHDSYLMARFRRAGLIAFGKTNVPELGLVPTTEGKLYGPARNPWNQSLSPGGSSGGAAAAVAAGIVPLAHANDGGGSIRIPASACGLVGLKPSRGRVSAGPDLPDGVDGLVAELVLSRSVRDTAVALDIASGNEPGDPYSAPPAPASYRVAACQPPQKLRIAYTKTTLDDSAVHPDCAAAIDHAAKLCASQGHVLEEASPSIPMELFESAFPDLWCSHLASVIEYVARMSGCTPGPDNLEGLTLAYYEAGKTISAARYIRAKMILNRLTRGIAGFHRHFDLWLTPSLGDLPWPLGRFDPDRRDLMAAMIEFGAYVPFLPLQNVTGQPAINLPLYWNASGIPVGVQFVGAFGDELTLLQLATQLEQAAPWAERYHTLKF